MIDHKILSWRLLSGLLALLMLIPVTLFSVPLPVARAVDTGWRNPSANAADPGGDGNGFEVLPMEAYADGSDFARNVNGYNDGHLYYNFGFDPFAFPSGAVIAGIEMRLDGWADSTFNSPRYDVELSWNGGTSWSDVRSTSNLGNSEATFFLGGQSDLWGHTWSADELADENLRVRITSIASGVGRWNRDFFLDWVTVHVYYASARIIGTIWADDNANGVQEDTEAGLDGVHVTIYQDDGDGVFEGGGDDPQVGFGDTDALGAYETGPFMDSLTYWVDVDTLAGRYLTTPPEPRLVSLPDGNSVTVNFGYVPLPLEIAKTPDTQTVFAGSSVTFTIGVTNTSTFPLANVQVTDALVPNCNANLGTLDPGQSASYSCILDDVATDFTNTATVMGTLPNSIVVTNSDTAFVDVFRPEIQIAKTPDTQMAVSGSAVTFTIAVTNTGDVPLTNVSVSDALAPDCARSLTDLAPGESQGYECAFANVTDSFTNSAATTGTPPHGTAVTATDTADVILIHSGIAIAKTPDAQTVMSGSTATFNIAITNTSDVTLSNVTILDALAPNCQQTFSTLGVGQSQSYNCTRANVTADFVNTVLVSGTPPVGVVVTATDTALVDVIHPALQIAKTPDTQMAVSGSTVTFTIAITNTGDVSLSNVVISDVLAPNCQRTFTTLGAGQSQSHTCALANVTADFTNTATVTGTPPAGSAVTAVDTAMVTIINPAIAIAKTPDTQTVRSGSTVTFTIAVTNTGDVALSNVQVTDNLAPDCSADLGSLDAKANSSYTCSLSDATASLNNRATVFGAPPVGAVVTATDTAVVTVIHPSITIAKMPKVQIALSGDTVTFTIAVTNSGDVTLLDAQVSDVLAPNCNAHLGMLNAGASNRYTCSLGNVTTNLTNTATVTGTPPVGTSVTAADTAIVRQDETQTCPAAMTAYWKLDEISGPPYRDFYDGHDGQCAGQCPTPVAGRINGGQAFDGSNTGIDAPAHASFDWGANDSFSIEFWMQTDSASTCAGAQVVIGRDDNPAPLHWWVGCQEGGQAAVYFRDTSNILAGVTGITDLTNGAWHHIVAVRDASANRIRIYVDGSEENSTAATFATGFASPTAALNIGWLHRPNRHRFAGAVDEVALYNRMLSANEVRRHYFDGLAGRWYCEAGGPAPDSVKSFLPIILKSR